MRLLEREHTEISIFDRYSINTYPYNKNGGLVICYLLGLNNYIEVKSVKIGTQANVIDCVAGGSLYNNYQFRQNYLGNFKKFMADNKSNELWEVILNYCGGTICIAGYSSKTEVGVWYPRAVDTSILEGFIRCIQNSIKNL